MKSGIPECREKLADRFLIRRSLHSSISITEYLPHHTFLANLALGQNTPQLNRIRETRIRNSGNLAFGIEIQIDFFVCAAVAGGALDQDGLFLALAADCVEAL